MARERGKREAPKKHRFLKFLGGLLVTLVCCFAILFVVNFGFSLSLRHYINSFDPVDYSDVDRVLPAVDQETGYYTFTTDDDLKIMMLTDIHLGGGCWSHTKDKKTIYEVITMLQQEKPDLVILDGDNTFAVPGPVYNGGGTLNNAMAAKDVIEIFEHEGVYFTTVFGNHDTEVFDYTGRQKLAEIYMDEKYDYCIFNQDFTDSDADIPSVTNQIIQVKNTKGEITKAILLLDSNAYVDESIRAVLDWDYDIIHEAEVDWAKSSLEELGNPKTLAFFHIPTSEFRVAYEELAANDWKDTENSRYVSGVWDEKMDETVNSRIWHGGITRTDVELADIDNFFEELGPDGANLLEACFCGHDHVNNGVVTYKGVSLVYGYSLDNLAYTGINESGCQRGSTVITVKSDGTWSQQHKNVYEDYGAETDKFYDVYLDHLLYGDEAPAGVLFCK